MLALAGCVRFQADLTLSPQNTVDGSIVVAVALQDDSEDSRDAALTAAQQLQFDRGRDIYRNICAGCHQPDGRGLDRIAPALVGSPFALAPPDIPIRILMNGKEGATGLMPPVGGSLNDEQIASVLTYVRREWGQSADPVDEAAVTAVRGASARRTRPWTDAELNALAGGRGSGRE